MDVLEARSRVLATAPAGCAFLRVVADLGLTPAAAVAPLAAFRLLGWAISDVTVWSPQHADTVAALLAEGPRLQPLARALLAEPGAAWWFAPLDRHAQLVAGRPLGRMGVSGLTQPEVHARPPTTSERYGQSPDWGLYTSTERNGLSALLVGGIEQSGDLGPVALPVARHRLTVGPDARVFEVDGPAAWDLLCRRYPATYEGQLGPDRIAGGARSGVELVPDWAAVAGDWDGVHVGFGGLLAAEQVRVVGAEGWTCLWAWNAEMTVWFRWVFTEVAQLPDLPGLPPSPW